MNMIRTAVAAFIAAGMLVPSFGYVPPTDAQIERILADHSQLNAALQGATPAQAAQTVVMTLAELESSSLPAASKQQTAALLYVRALLLSGENAPQMVESLAGQLGSDLIPVLAASTAVAVGSNEGPVFASLQKVGGDAVAAAAANPGSVLGDDLIGMIQQLVIELRGVAAPVIPPPATAPMTLVPPIVPRGAGAPTPPPVASTYVNQ
ncbi:MAG TPA: hypothetical protein PKE12_15025 [Kiritimatiellia bacterium]|nr:hypothetical protein [Kiritimatiellia bacterium]